MKNLCPLILLVIPLMAVVFFTGCPSGGGGTPPPPPPPGITFLDKSEVWGSVDFDMSEEPVQLAEQPFSRFLVKGQTCPNSSYWVVPKAVTSNGHQATIQITRGKVTYLPIVGTDDNPEVGNPIVIQFVVEYVNGVAIFHDATTGVVISNIVLANTQVTHDYRFLPCGAITWFIGPGAGFFCDLVSLVQGKSAPTGPQWMELLINSHDLCSIDWEVEYNASYGSDNEHQLVARHIDFDFDCDGLTNKWEIEHWTDPYSYDCMDCQETTDVPNVVGETLDDAGSILNDAGLQVGTVTYESNQAPADEVIHQTPAAGTTVVVDTAVDLVVSTGPEPLWAQIEEPGDWAQLHVGQKTKVKVSFGGGSGYGYHIHITFPDTQSPVRPPVDLYSNAAGEVSCDYYPAFVCQFGEINVRVTDSDGNFVGPGTDSTTIPITVVN